MVISNKTDISIIIPSDATQREVFSAEELKKFLKRIIEISADIVDDSKNVDGNKIIIGGPARNKFASLYINEKKFDEIVPGPEGIFIKNFDSNTIIIAGSNNQNSEEKERGTIYATYEFLERYLGANFSTYSSVNVDDVDNVSKVNSADLSDICYIKAKSDLPYRTAIVQYGDFQGNPDHDLNIPFLNWLIRNRYNRILTWSGIYEGYKKNGTIEEAEKRGFNFSVGHHAAPKAFLPPFGNEYFEEKYYETHPEYYKLTSEGTRFYTEGFGGQWIFCSRNEDVIKEVTKNILTWISENPIVDVIAFWPQDTKAEQCQCDECSKHSKVSNYTYFLNSVAKAVGAVYPNVKIDLLSYVDLWEPPENLKLEPNLIVDEATWHDSGLRKGGKPDGSSIINTVFDSNILKWKNLGAEVVFYDYYMGIYSGRNRLLPIADEIQAISKYYVDKGISGSGTQIECFNIWNHIFNLYSFARTMYDTSLSFETLLERFVQIFGSGGKYIAEIITELEAFVDNQTDVEKVTLLMMENIDKNKFYELYEKALAVAEEPYQRNNVRMMRMVFRYTDIECYEFGLENHSPYPWLREYPDKTGELYFLSRYDSFVHNNPGYGVTIPVKCEKSEKFIPDKWYEFE